MNSAPPLVKWFTPGIGVKRWIALVVIGVIALTVGLTLGILDLYAQSAPTLPYTPPLGVGLLLLVAVQRQGELGHLHRSFARTFYAPRVAPLDRLPADEEPYRIIGLGSALLPNSAALWGLEDIRGDQGPLLGRSV